MDNHGSEILNSMMSTTRHEKPNVGSFVCEIPYYIFCCISDAHFAAPLSNRTSNNASLRGTTFSPKTKLPAVNESHDSVSNSNLRIFSMSELKVATRNFRPDTVLGEGGFGRVYKGRLQEKSTMKMMEIAVKRLSPESMQGFKEWLAELNFLGKLSHPNLVKLLGYCCEDKELLFVYEFMNKGSLENHLFGSKRLDCCEYYTLRYIQIFIACFLLEIGLFRKLIKIKTVVETTLECS